MIPYRRADWATESFLCDSCHESRSILSNCQHLNLCDLCSWTCESCALS